MSQWKPATVEYVREVICLIQTSGYCIQSCIIWNRKSVDYWVNIIYKNSITISYVKEYRKDAHQFVLHMTNYGILSKEFFFVNFQKYKYIHYKHLHTKNNDVQ